MAKAKTITFLLVIAVLSLCARVTHADMPLFEGIEEAKSVGPRTEAIDLTKYQRVIYVSAGAPAGPADGGKEHPFATVQAAIDSVQQAGATQRQTILVASGTYKAANLRMKEFVDLFGGFDSNWKRDIFEHPSILDAAQAGPVILGADNARLDGFVITNGRNKGPGGGIVCDHVSPEISNNLIRGNATVPPDGFRQDMIHQKGSDGGGIALLAGSNAVVRGNVICQNTTGIGNGGGIFIWNECSKPKILQNIIFDNHTGLAGKPGHDGSRSSNGGGIAVSLSCHPEIIANVIGMNTVADNSDAGGIYLEYDAHAHLKGNWIVGNFGMDDGGGMYVMKNSDPIVERNVFAGNRNTSGGSGAIRLSKEGRMRATNNLIAGNSTGIDAVHSWMILKNNTFVDCITNAIVYENAAQHMSPPQIAGNIFHGPMKLPIHLKHGKADPNFSHNLIPGGFAGEQNMDVDPKFIDDSVKGTITDRRFDPARYQTVITPSDAQLTPDALAGRVVNVGGEWSVIQANDARQLTVWGDISDKTGRFLIQGTYRLAEDSPCRDLGAYAK